jgi:hypothetical protein
LQAGSNILGNVSAFSSADTLRLGGGTNSTLTCRRSAPVRSIRVLAYFRRPAAAPGH